jgi:hypothetical protein
MKLPMAHHITALAYVLPKQKTTSSSLLHVEHHN